jgi:hypothetical protein
MHASDTSECPPNTEPTLRAIAMPADVNPQGDIFGGWLLPDGPRRQHARDPAGERPHNYGGDHGDDLS